jgi:mRNA-degrading endonuclease RelE of RelBE toxin-antitoxin system
MSEGGKAGFEVRLRSKRVQRELDQLKGGEFNRVFEAIKSLEFEPRPSGSEKIFKSIFRLRIGRIRVIYLIDEGNRRVDIGAVRRRSEKTYRDIKGLFM